MFHTLNDLTCCTVIWPTMRATFREQGHTQSAQAKAHDQSKQSNAQSATSQGSQRSECDPDLQMQVQIFAFSLLFGQSLQVTIIISCTLHLFCVGCCSAQGMLVSILTEDLEQPTTTSQQTPKTVQVQVATQEDSSRLLIVAPTHSKHTDQESCNKTRKKKLGVPPIGVNRDEMHAIAETIIGCTIWDI